MAPVAFADVRLGQKIAHGSKGNEFKWTFLYYFKINGTTNMKMMKQIWLLKQFSLRSSNN